MYYPPRYRPNHYYSPPEVPVKRHYEHEEQERLCYTIRLSNISDSVDDAMLYDLFRPFSKIREIRWIYTPAGSTGRCFLQFEEPVAKQAAKLQGYLLAGRPLQIRIE
eukprot:TRINITY_DN12051_c0_g3_i1.p2 TRINITY_DN12051_c0_g3~~TRINITY_DN12051_c0_g3_i1.p2  ORF type:complete len:107 (+),score=15.00 TRINITY_DN12051_c0_g3_i1:51-371(+)